MRDVAPTACVIEISARRRTDRPQRRRADYQTSRHHAPHEGRAFDEEECEYRARPCGSTKRLKANAFAIRRGCLAGCGPAGAAAPRQLLPPALPAVNHKGQAATMRVSATSSLAPARDSQAARRVGSGFSLGDFGQAAARISTGHLQAIGGIDTLVALQGMDDPAERRRRAVRKGRSALDALDALKLGLVSGDLDASALNRLRAMAADLPGTCRNRPGIRSSTGCCRRSTCASRWKSPS